MAWPRERRVRQGSAQRRALRTAAMLDELVDAQLPLVVGLAEPSARRAAEYLAALVMLGQAYRWFAAGWIGRRELHRRGRECVATLERMTRRPDAARALRHIGRF
ncbi:MULTISPECIES: hypothetical protein [Actinoalloteichus]|uniref:Uncharacterized protein n=1 Tax=Actinoalloteichus fjordicus TaxID=1612552 RepID=A0AAC9L968_9PSEU|nr:MULTISPECIES: hypothetical protein [Actinoalloteichus]APU12145.1 hypothetical protein UA74_00225 [Actinoalloteichus fjordicus]APU18097.1 hypothetical protein UA75_00225 [Actinoalloteichus sp. GBA129-24]